MAVSYGSSSTTGAEVLGTSIDVPVPSGAAADDVVLVGLNLEGGSDPTVTPPSGFSLILKAVSGDVHVHVFGKLLTGADTGNYTFAWSGNMYKSGQAICVTGATLTGVQSNSATGSGTSIGSTSVTTSTPPFLAHFIGNAPAFTSKTPPTSFTETQENGYFESAYRIPGSSGSQSASGASQDGSITWAAVLVGLEEAAPAPAAGLARPTPPFKAGPWGLPTRIPLRPIQLGEPSAVTGQTLALGTAEELDTAQPLGKAKTKTITQALETDTAQPIGRAKTRSLGIAVESDAAQPVAGKAKAKTVGLATETDTAQPLGERKTKAAAAAQETDTALTLGETKRRTLGVALATEAAQALGEAKTKALGLAAAIETALSIGRAKRRTLGTSNETDTALTLTPVTGNQLGTAAETDTALGIARRKTRAAALAAATETATAIGRVKTRTLATAAASEAAQALGRVKARLLGLAATVETALLPGRSKTKAVQTAVEIDAAQQIVPGGRDITVTATLGRRRWVGSLADPNDRASLGPRRWTGGLE